MNTLKVITYNVDGIPQSIDLNDLPWVLKPIAWIYKLIKKTTIIPINSTGDRKNDTLRLSEGLSKLNPDIIGVQEDFNYHEELMSSLSNYRSGTVKGGFNPKKIFSSVDWFSSFPYPRFKTDGLNILIKPKLNIASEEIIKWSKSSGYFKRYNDKVAKKGFRRYTLNITGTFNLDLYVLHMDAGSDEKDIKAKGAQLKQLSEYIIDRYKVESVPAIIIGDFNSTPNNENDVENMKSYFMDRVNVPTYLTMQEAIPSNGHSIDRIFYINNTFSDFKIEPSKCSYDYSFKGMSDHCPVIAEFICKRI